VKIWAEDPTEPANSSRRFRKIWQQRSPTGVPFVGVGFKFSGVETVLALTTRDGFLTVWEPNDEVAQHNNGGDSAAAGGGGEGDDLSSWKLWFEDHLCATPSRTEETSFRLSWHAEKFPPYPAILAGLDRKSLALAVAVGEKVRIYRTDQQRKFYVAATLEGARGLVRDVAWANGSMRGWDLIATCARDGYVRVYEVHTPASATAAAANPNGNTPAVTPGAGAENGDSASHQNHPPSLTPLTSPPTLTPSSTTTTLPKLPHRTSSNPHHHQQRSSNLRSQLLGGRDGKRPENSNGPGAIQQDVKLVAELEAHEGAPWRVAWSPLGEILVSTGDDGRVGMWRRSLEGRWRESGEVDLVGEMGR
jgi:WD40 repeat protein